MFLITPSGRVLVQSRIELFQTASIGYPVNPGTIGHRIRKKGMGWNFYQKDLAEKRLM
jgi:hypothetical protein